MVMRAHAVAHTVGTTPRLWRSPGSSTICRARLAPETHVNPPMG